MRLGVGVGARSVGRGQVDAAASGAQVIKRGGPAAARPRQQRFGDFGSKSPGQWPASDGCGGPAPARRAIRVAGPRPMAAVRSCSDPADDSGSGGGPSS
eukprot:CAMPEP_0172184404 /NCGR_PEP_ID=MMETSP1050-20130122/19558_1 /TAXON_ID=233186 /ORGANISM="Cryptomonas curvata, Strain CCAP979/52" /LENGTH=98 /DNA_ID=CAMNT_0012858201 /DNA_START=98 /DNA_END=391 /DNA_ORIENTATION=+